MYATCHLKANELDDSVIKTLKDVYHDEHIVVLPVNAYYQLEKASQNAEYLAKLDKANQEIDEGKGIVKMMKELEAMDDK
jgi:phosphoribosylaminoimidazole-succinocarboxamide synthase